MGPTRSMTASQPARLDSYRMLRIHLAGDRDTPVSEFCVSLSLAGLGPADPVVGGVLRAGGRRVGHGPGRLDDRTGADRRSPEQ